MRPASRSRWRVPPRWAKTRRNRVANSQRNQVAKTQRNQVAKSTGIRSSLPTAQILELERLALVADIYKEGIRQF